MTLGLERLYCEPATSSQPKMALNAVSEQLTSDEASNYPHPSDSALVRQADDDLALTNRNLDAHFAECFPCRSKVDTLRRVLSLYMKLEKELDAMESKFFRNSYKGREDSVPLDLKARLFMDALSSAGSKKGRR